MIQLKTSCFNRKDLRFTKPFYPHFQGVSTVFLSVVLSLIFFHSSAQNALISNPDSTGEIRESIIVKLEEYISLKYSNSNFWKTYEKNWKKSGDKYSVVYEALYSKYSELQQKLFQECLDKMQVSGADLMRHEYFLKENLDSIFSLYANWDESDWDRHFSSIISPPAPQPTGCENVDFENCNYSNWQTFNGTKDEQPYGFINPLQVFTFNDGSAVADGPQHSIISLGDWDAQVPVKTVYPGGKCSAVLGDATGIGAKASRMKRSFAITNDNYNFFYSYNVVMQNPSGGHSAGQRPFFTVRMFDQNGKSIDCAKYEVYAGDGKPSWITKNNGSTPIVYTDWVQALVPLQSYIGQNVTIEFTVGDCSLGGHWAYAYVEAHCLGKIPVADTLTCPNVPVTITGPSGGSKYVWSNGKTTQSISVTEPGLYSVDVTGTAGGGCSATFYTKLGLKEYPKSEFKTDTVCLHQSSVFMDKSVKATTGIKNWQWDFNNDNVVESTSQNPTFLFSKKGDNQVKLTVEDVNGCKDDTLINVYVRELPVPNFSSTSNCAGDSVAFKNLSTGYASVKWDFLNKGNYTSSAENPKYLFATVGNYPVKIKAISKHQCADSVVKTVTINALPKADFSSTKVCFQSETNFTDLSSISSGKIANWEWNFGDSTEKSMSQHPKHTYSKFGVYYAKLKVTSDANCVDSIQKPVTLFAKPDVGFEVNNVCIDQVLSFKNNSTATGESFKTWKWVIDSVSPIINTSKEIVHSFSNEGKHSVTLIGTTQNDCSDTLKKYLTVYPSPKAQFAVKSVCFNQDLKFVDNSQGDIKKWSWSFYNNAQVNSTVQNPSFKFPQSGNYVSKLKVTNTYDCVDSTTVSVNVHPLPKADFTYSKVCYPNAIPFTNNSTISSGNIASHEWVFGNSLSQSNSINPTFLPDTNGSYLVKLKVTSDSACLDSTTLTINYLEKPIANFSFKDTCAFDQVKFTDLSSITSSKIVEWKWDILANQSVDYVTQNAAHQFAQSGLYNIQLIVKTQDGCADSVQKEITIFPLPIADFSATNVCFKDSSVFTNLSSVSSGSINQNNWQFEANKTSNSTNPKHLYSNEGKWQARLIVVTDHYCKDTVVKELLVWPLPIANFEATEVCEGFPTVFSNLSTVSNANTNNTLVSQQWNLGDGNSKNSQFSEYQYATEGTYVVDLMLQTDKSCKDTIQKTIIVNPLAKVQFESSLPEGCSEWCVDFTNTSLVKSGNIASYSWNFGNGMESTRTDASACYVNDEQEIQTFDIYLSATTDKGCFSDTLVQDYVKVFPITHAEFDFTPDQGQVDLTQIIFFNQSIGENQVLWNFGDEVRSTESNPKHTYSEDAVYNITLWVNNQYNCPDSITKPITINPYYTFYVPNAFTPNKDGLNDIFYIYGYNIIDAEMYIFNRWGEHIFTSENLHKGWDGSYRDGEAQMDVYIYKALLTDIFGKKHDLVGTVTLVR